MNPRTLPFKRTLLRVRQKMAVRRGHAGLALFSPFLASPEVLEDAGTAFVELLYVVVNQRYAASPVAVRGSLRPREMMLRPTVIRILSGIRGPQVGPPPIRRRVAQVIRLTIAEHGSWQVGAVNVRVPGVSGSDTQTHIRCLLG